MSNGNQDLGKAESAGIAPEMTWRDRIRIARERKGLSQTALGEIVGKAQNTISSYEKPGGNEPTLDVVEKIAEATDTTSLWIIFGIDGVSPAPTEDQPRFDRQKMQQVIAAVERRAQVHGLHDWPPESKARFVLAHYDIFLDYGGTIEELEKDIDKLLRRYKKDST